MAVAEFRYGRTRWRRDKILAPMSKRRRVERIRLSPPLTARIGSQTAVLIDISLMGARLEHQTPLAVGNKLKLWFRWREDELFLDTVVVRCKLDRFSIGQDGLTVYHSGVAFQHASEASRLGLRGIIETQVIRALEEQKANARGDIPEWIQKMPIFQRGGMLTASRAELVKSFRDAIPLPASRIAQSSGYLCYRMEGRSWRKIRTRKPEQPPEGFTVLDNEDQEQLELLCEAYEQSDTEMRHLIRIFAEMSITEDDVIPPQRFQP